VQKGDHQETLVCADNGSSIAASAHLLGKSFGVPPQPVGEKSFVKDAGPLSPAEQNTPDANTPTSAGSDRTLWHLHSGFSCIMQVTSAYNDIQRKKAQKASDLNKNR